MKFESKAQELLGKRFRNDNGDTIYFDPNEVWTEVKPRHIHQDLIDSYREGQAWQYTNCKTTDVWEDCFCAEEYWFEPLWNRSNQYRLHPHNDLIQAHSNGAVIQVKGNDEWGDAPNPSWFEDTQYRIKPQTKTAPEVEQYPKLWLSPEGFRIKLTKPEDGEVSGWIPLYTHTQPDQTALINQLTDELNKTEAERVRWKAMALTSIPKPKREPLSVNEIMALWNKRFEYEDELIVVQFARAIEKAHGIGG
jgi:hypothetical protein